NYSSVRGHDPAANAEAQSATLHAAIVTRIAAIEWLENLWQAFGRDPWSCVAYGQLGGILDSAKRQHHTAAPLIVFNGIIGEVQKQLPQPMAISLNRHRVTFDQFNFDFVRSPQTLGIRSRFLEQLVQSHRVASERNLAGIRLCEQGQPIDDLRQP